MKSDKLKKLLKKIKKIKINEKQVKKSQKPPKVETLSLPVDEASSSDSRRVPVQQPKPDIVKPPENTYKPIEYKNFFI